MKRIACVALLVLSFASAAAPAVAAADDDPSDAPPVTLDRSSWG